MHDLYMEGMEELYARPKSYQEWNNAIEAAAEEVDRSPVMFHIKRLLTTAIRKLKKP